MPVSSYFARDLVILMESRRFSLHRRDGNLAWIKSTYTLSVDQHWALGQIYCPYPIKTGGIVSHQCYATHTCRPSWSEKLDRVNKLFAEDQLQNKLPSFCDFL